MGCCGKRRMLHNVLNKLVKDTYLRIQLRIKKRLEFFRGMLLQHLLQGVSASGIFIESWRLFYQIINFKLCLE